MPRTQLNGAQVGDGTIQRADLDVATAGAAVIRKLIASSTITLTSTGPDAGTGDVTPAIAAGLLPVKNFSAATQSPFATDTYLAGSFKAFPSAPVAGSTYRLTFDVTKTAAGIVAPVINVRIGTAGTIADTARCTFTFGAGTAAVDTGIFVIDVVFGTVGSGTSAVLVGLARLINNLTTTGLSNSVKVAKATSAGFDSTVASLGIGVSYNGGASAAHTVTLVKTELQM